MPVGVAHHRHHQALLGADRDAEVEVVLVDDVVAVDLRVDGGNVLRAPTTGAREEAHESERRRRASSRSAPCAALRSAITALMSTSLKVVSMAAVCCALTSRSRDALAAAGSSWTRSSRDASSAGDGARTATEAAGRGNRSRRGGGALDRRHHVALGDAAVLAGAGDGSGIDAGSAAIRRTEGGAARSGAWSRLPRRPSAAAQPGSSSAALIGAVVEVFWSGRPVWRGRALAGRGGGCAGALLDAGRARRRPHRVAALGGDSPARRRRAPAPRSSPCRSRARPAARPTATASPGFLNHLPMVASVTDSPRVGTRISAMDFVPSDM